MTTATTSERTIYDMGSEEIKMLFEDLREIRKGQEAQSKDMTEVKLKLNDLENGFANIETKLGELNCIEHAEDLKKASDFILVHDTKEKTLFGIRSDVIAWVGFAVSITVGGITVYKFIHP